MDRLAEDIFLQNLVYGSRSFDWLTVLTLFLVGLFYMLPQLLGQELIGRSRICFITAIWLLVAKLLLHLIQILLTNFELFTWIVTSGGPRPGPRLSAIVGCFFPVIEGLIFVLALLLVAVGLPGFVQFKPTWQPEPPRRSEDRGARMEDRG